ncbi:hypothetical protein [Tunturiibacter gelidoferens]|uniref:Uncharacterized protein n=1 Tax=Tunturiibacter lichenicola TaxID=2051959 RepID=A0A7Y9T3M2_9BACT|nr:hypothetical protein [Edaphobacter lichenicola]NYF52452.1 hypothetical protein [Edaphobacter lichenicola]
MAISRAQVELELNRILKSEFFAGGKYPAAEKTGQLLRHIVEATLDEKPLTQNALLMDFYGFAPSQLDASRDDARIGVLRLRKKLDNYNAGAGADDSVVITIPKGQYRAVFAENPSSPIQKEIRLGFRQLAAETMPHLYRALNHFERAIELQLANAEAWGGLASTYVATATDALAYDVDCRVGLRRPRERKPSHIAYIMSHIALIDFQFGNWKFVLKYPVTRSSMYQNSRLRMSR